MLPKKRSGAAAAAAPAAAGAGAAETATKKKQKTAAGSNAADASDDDAAAVAPSPEDKQQPGAASAPSPASSAAAPTSKLPVVTDSWATGANLPDRIVRMVRHLRTAASAPDGYIRRVDMRMIIPRSGEQFLHFGKVWLDDGTTRYRYPDRTPTGLFKPSEAKTATARNARLPGGSYAPSEDNCYDLKDLVDELERPRQQEGVNPLVDFLLARRDDWPHVQKGGIRYKLGCEDDFRGNMYGVTPEQAPSYPKEVYLVDCYRNGGVRMSDDEQSFVFRQCSHKSISARVLTMPVNTIVPLRCGDADPPGFFTLSSIYFFTRNLGGSYARYKTAAAKEGYQIVPLGEVGGVITGSGSHIHDLEDIPDHILDLEAWERFQALTPEERARVQEATKPPPPAPKVKKTPAPAEASSGDAPAAAASAERASSDGAAGEEPAASPSNKSKKTKLSAAAAAAAEAASGVVDLAGKRFVVMGEFDRGKFRVESQIANAGGVVTKAVAKTVSYVICGRPVATQYGGVSGKGSKAYSEAKKMKISILDESEFQKLLDAHDAHKKAGLQGIASGLIPDLSNIVAEYASSAPDDGSELGAVWLDICRLRGLEAKADGGVTDEQIRAVEEQLQLALPRDLKSVLKVSNGSNSAEHPSPLFPSLQTIAHANKHGMAILFREEGFKYLSLSNGLYMNLRGNSIMRVEPGGSLCVHLVALSLRALLETYREVIRLKLVDFEDRVQDALTRGLAHSEHHYLRTNASAKWLSAHPVPEGESAEARAAREENEVRELRGAQAHTEMDDIRGPHADAIARYKRYVDRRIAARAVALQGQPQPAAEPATAAASSSASAAPASIPTVDEVQLGRPLSFPEMNYEFRKKHSALLNRFYGEYS